MPPSDSNGVYALPTGYEAVTGETIQASQHNPPLEDIASALSQRLMRSGAAPMTGPLKLADGSASAPAAAFGSATGTGFYKTAGGGFGVAINGTQVAEFASGGLSKGGKFIGELFGYVCTNPPPLCVFPVGQTLSRTTYADLWAVAQTEISAGNLFFNNGNGSTTFGVGDLRGRVIAAKDNMGGTAAGRLTADFFGGNSPSVLGNAAGAQSVTLSLTQIPTFTPSGSVGSTFSGTTLIPFFSGQGFGGPGGTTPLAVNGDSGSAEFPVSGTVTSAFTGIPIGGGGAHLNVQPTMITNIAMFAGA